MGFLPAGEVIRFQFDVYLQVYLLVSITIAVGEVFLVGLSGGEAKDSSSDNPFSTSLSECTNAASRLLESISYSIEKGPSGMFRWSLRSLLYSSMRVVSGEAVRHAGQHAGVVVHWDVAVNIMYLSSLHVTRRQMSCQTRGCFISIGRLSVNWTPGVSPQSIRLSRTRSH